MNERALRAVGFLLLVLGLGLLMDSPWQALGWLLVVAGAIPTGAGLWLLAARDPTRAAFVRTRRRG